MDKRKRIILRAITDDYIQTAEPVGSRTIARKYRLGVSPATIRNEMADLEESGYLQQPHTSAGRIPSDKGYRFYVDMLMAQAVLSEIEKERLRLQVHARVVEELLYRATRLLAALTHCAAVAITPTVANSIIKAVKFVHIDEKSVLVVVVSEPGFVQHRIVEKSQTSATQLLTIGHEVTYVLRGLPAGSISPTIRAEIATTIGDTALFDALMDMLQLKKQPLTGESVFIEGSVNLMDQPEFREVSKARTVLAALEEPNLLYALLSQVDGMNVVIGTENDSEAMQECSVVSATYSAKGRTSGTISVVGPTRMDYIRTIALVECVAEAITDILCRSEKS